MPIYIYGLLFSSANSTSTDCGASKKFLLAEGEAEFKDPITRISLLSAK